MERLKKTVAAGLILLIGMFSFQVVMQYSYKPEGDKTYDYLSGEVPPDGGYALSIDSM